MDNNTRVHRIVLIETAPEYVLEPDPEDPRRRISIECVACGDSIMGSAKQCFIVSTVGTFARKEKKLICRRCGNSLIGS